MSKEEQIQQNLQISNGNARKPGGSKKYQLLPQTMNDLHND